MIKKFFYKIYLFFYYLTKKGKEEKYWNDAEANLEKSLLEKGAQELEVKQKCVKFAQKQTKKKKLSNFHLAKITTKKHEKELNDVAVKIDSRTLKFKDA